MQPLLSLTVPSDSADVLKCNPLRNRTVARFHKIAVGSEKCNASATPKCRHIKDSARGLHLLISYCNP